MAGVLSFNISETYACYQKINNGYYSYFLWISEKENIFLYVFKIQE